MSNKFPELAALQHFVERHKVTISSRKMTPIANNLTPILFNIGSDSFIIHVHDEYNDLEHNNPLLNVVLVLNEFLYVNDSNDFLNWCSWQNADANNTQLLAYYKDMCDQTHKIKKYFPNQKITAFVSNLDNQLNSGSMHYLRTNKVI